LRRAAQSFDASLYRGIQALNLVTRVEILEGVQGVLLYVLLNPQLLFLCLMLPANLPENILT